MNIKEMIEFHISNGLAVIPIKFREKTPLIDWGKYQKERATKEEVQKWFSGDVGINVAVVCGGISGNLVVVDFDDPRAYKKLFSGIDKETIVVKTGRGFHVYFRTDYPVSGFAINIPSLGRIDVKGEGGYVLAPPSVHPSGKTYEFISQLPIKSWPGDFKLEFLELIHRIFKVKTAQEKVNITKLLEGVAEGQRDEAAIRVTTWFRKQGLNEERTLAKLKEWNQRNKPPLEESALATKVNSAFRPEEPYAYDFEEANEETYNEEETGKARASLKNLSSYGLFMRQTPT